MDQEHPQHSEKGKCQNAPSEENKDDLERVQKSALKSYENALNFLEMETLDARREGLCLEFAKKCLKNEKIKKYLPKNVAHVDAKHNEYSNTFGYSNNSQQIYSYSKIFRHSFHGFKILQIFLDIHSVKK